MKLRLLTCITLIAALHYNLIFAADSSNLDHLSLSDAEKLFVSNNRELLAAKRAVEGSQADTLSAAQKPNPTLSFNASNFNLNRKAGNTNPEGGGGITNQTISSVVGISQLFERGDKREIRMAVANNVLKASQYNFKDTVRQQDLILKVAYYDLLLAQESEQVQLTIAALYDKTLEAAELRLKAGDIASSDVARIRVDALRAKNDLRQAQATHQKAQANLAYIIGKEQEANSIVGTDAWPGIYVADATGQPAIDTDKLNDRADIKAAEAFAQAADENRHLAEALKTRDVTMGLQYQHFPGQGPGNGENTVGAAISIPLFTNYQYQGEIARAEVDYTTALEAREQARATAIGEITRARADLDASIEKVRRFDQQMLAEAKKAADAAEFAYQHGAMGVTDLLDARRIQRALELDAASVRADYAKSLAAWQAATNPEENP